MNTKGRVLDTPMPAPPYWPSWFEKQEEERGFVLLPRPRAIIEDIANNPNRGHDDYELLFNLTTIGGDHQGELYTVNCDDFEQWWLIKWGQN